MSSLLTSPMVDLDTGAVIAHPATVDATGSLRAAPLPMIIELPVRTVLPGADDRRNAGTVAVEEVGRWRNPART